MPATPGDGVLEIAPHADNQGEETMPEAPTAQFGSLHDQNMAAMGQAMTRFQNDVVTVSKAADYHYLQDKNLISQEEAVGVREVGSEKNPGGPSKPA